MRLNQCYGATMYDCVQSSVIYMNFPGTNCGGSFPDSYNIPAFLCLPPAYAYSRDDTYFRCY
eukprot:scaffold2708_cov158-Ochromonas_danica.AAC.24